jgi:hypothetical protein
MIIPLEIRHFCYLDPTPSVDSAILSGEPADFLTRLTSWAGNTNTIWNLCWRATKHGWALSTFHSKCDYKKPTVTIIKVGNFIFGGYATESWEGEIYNSFSHQVLTVLNTNMLLKNSLWYRLGTWDRA